MTSLRKYCLAASCLMALNAAPALADTIAITGGTVHTVGAKGTLENATVLIRDGKIAAVGVDVAVPSDATVIDASGQVVAPGFMHSNSMLGLSEISAVKSTNAHSARNTDFGAAFDVEYGLNYRSVVIADNRRQGLTQAVTLPSGSGDIFRGSGAVISLNSAPDMVIGNGPMVANLDAGGNRSVAWAKLHVIFDEVLDYKRNRSAVRKGKGRSDYMLSPLNMDALIPVVDGDKLLVLQLNSEVDIRKAIQLKNKYDLKLVIQGAREAWRVAADLAAADIAVVIDPNNNLPADFDQVWTSRSNAARLQAAGVKFAISPTGMASNHNASIIGQVAAIAVAHGLDWDAALKSVTSAPAEIFGLGDYGTLEAGKVANVVVWDGDPLEVTSGATHVIVDGEDMPLVSRRTMLRDKYLNR